MVDVTTVDKRGWMNIHGEMLFPCELDQVELVSERVWRVTKSGKMAILQPYKWTYLWKEQGF